MFCDEKLRIILIDLYNTHSNSVLLRNCLKEVSVFGYNDDILTNVENIDIFLIFQNLFFHILNKVIHFFLNMYYFKKNSLILVNLLSGIKIIMKFSNSYFLLIDIKYF
jgi:hypothetical protein